MRNRPLKVDQFVALPANADSETYGADPPGPFRDEARFWMKVRDWERSPSWFENRKEGS
jgi:hypothetical protein